MNGSRTDRAQSGLDRLMLFVIAVVILLVVAPLVLGAVGIDVGGQPTGGPAAGSHDLLVLEARGTAVDDGSIGAVRLVVTASPGREPVDLGGQLAVWTADRSYYLSPTEADGFDGTYRASVIDGEGQVLERESDRGVLVFDLGPTDDVDGVPEFGSRLAAGETATVTIVTPRGETLRRQLTVPDRVSGESVPL